MTKMRQKNKFGMTKLNGYLVYKFHIISILLIYDYLSKLKLTQTFEKHLGKDLVFSSHCYKTIKNTNGNTKYPSRDITAFKSSTYLRESEKNAKWVFFFLAIIPLLEWELYDKVFTGLIYEFLLIYSLLSGTNSMSGLLSSHQQDMFR